jgi:ribosomal protein L29
MTTSEILEVVKRMQKDWEMAIDNPQMADISNCEYGFCFWILKFLGLSCDNPITAELAKDLRSKKKKMTWYRTFSQIGKKALIPRLNHLNRTISRLETQLKNEQNGTIH